MWTRNKQRLTFSLEQVLVHEIRPLLSLLLWNLGKTKPGQVDDVERIPILGSGDVVAITDLTRELGFVVHGEVVGLLDFAGSFAGECQGFAVGQLFCIVIVHCVLSCINYGNRVRYYMTINQTGENDE